ncbi:hypothetical protein BVX98_01030 [bacterium F11]|nr:hypothetical protein BVX98_01030 [bacterium F11]
MIVNSMLDLKYDQEPDNQSIRQRPTILKLLAMIRMPIIIKYSGLPSISEQSYNQKYLINNMIAIGTASISAIWNKTIHPEVYSSLSFNFLSSILILT